MNLENSNYITLDLNNILNLLAEIRIKSHSTPILLKRRGKKKKKTKIETNSKEYNKRSNRIGLKMELFLISFLLEIEFDLFEAI